LSTNNKVEDILHPEAIGIIAQKVKSVLDAKAAKNNAFGAVNEYMPDNAVSIEDKHYEKIEQIYNNQIMVEHLSSLPENPAISQAINYYKKGISELSVAAKAHDFIIPTSYQLTYYNKLITQDRNQPNFDANHLTGSSIKYKAGNENFNYIMEKLRELMKTC
jgi:hypothetical protein